MYAFQSGSSIFFGQLSFSFQVGLVKCCSVPVKENFGTLVRFFFNNLNSVTSFFSLFNLLEILQLFECIEVHSGGGNDKTFFIQQQAAKTADFVHMIWFSI